MKLKFTQSVYVLGTGVVNTGDELEIKNKRQAESLIVTGYAIEIKKPKKPTRRKVAKEEVGE